MNCSKILKVNPYSKILKIIILFGSIYFIKIIDNLKFLSVSASLNRYTTVALKGHYASSLMKKTDGEFISEWKLSNTQSAGLTGSSNVF